MPQSDGAVYFFYTTYGVQKISLADIYTQLIYWFIPLVSLYYYYYYYYYYFDETDESHHANVAMC